MRRSFVILLLIIISFLLQSVIFSYHNVRGIAPNLLLIVTMSFGIMRGRREGLLTGFVSGFLYDIFFGTLLGPYTAVLAEVPGDRGAHAAGRGA